MIPPRKAGVLIHPFLWPSLWLFEHKDNLKQVSQQQKTEFVKLNLLKQKASFVVAFSPPTVRKSWKWDVHSQVCLVLC